MRHHPGADVLVRTGSSVERPQDQEAPPHVLTPGFGNSVGVQLLPRQLCFMPWSSEVKMGITHSVEAVQGSSAAEDRLRLVIDSAPALIHTSLPDGYLDFFNQSWLNYLGVSLEDVAGWKWTAVIHPEDVAAIVEKWRTALATGKPFEHEARVRRADGEYRWMFHHKVPLRDERGNIVKWYGSSIDIEDRKRAEEQVRRSEFYLAEGQRPARTGSWAFNPSGFFDHWSLELFRIYGLDPANGMFLKRKHIKILFHAVKDLVAKKSSISSIRTPAAAPAGGARPVWALTSVALWAPSVSAETAYLISDAGKPMLQALATSGKSPPAAAH